MAVTEKNQKAVLRLKFIVGSNDGGDVRYKRKDIKNVKFEASNDDVYAVGSALSGLLEKGADVITKVEEVDFEPGI